MISPLFEKSLCNVYESSKAYYCSALGTATLESEYTLEVKLTELVYAVDTEDEGERGFILLSMA